jgi:1-deoxy-D-xylulose-5-phosphate reductoisomerase
VEAFLEGRISFPAIAEVVEETLNRVPGRSPSTVAEVLEVDVESRAEARRVAAGVLNGNSAAVR